jgi:hypothetical protein
MQKEKNFGAFQSPIYPPCHAYAIKSGKRAKHMVVLMHKLLIPIIAATTLASNPSSIQAEDVAQTKIFKAGELITVSSWLMEVGGRYLTSAGKSNWEALGTSRTTQVSGLADDKLTTQPADAFWYVDPASATLAKGPSGVGLMISNHLRHQDFPPVIRLYATSLSKPQDGSLTIAAFEQRYSVWSTPHYPLAPFVADPRWREPHAGFASTHVTSNPDHCFTTPIYLTGLDRDARWDSLRLWCGGSTCTYTQPAALGRCGVGLKLSQYQ